VGWCWWYRKYAPGDTTLEGLEKAVRETRIAVWADPHLVPPWEWYLFRGMMEKSTWKMYDFGLMSTPVESDPFMATLGETVEEFGGVCEMVAGCLLVYLPSECDLDLMKEAARISQNLNLPIPKICN
jgi:hypothetical protein